MKTTAIAFTTAALLAAGTAVHASTVVAFDNFGGDELNLTSFTGEETYGSSSDGFQEYVGPGGAPFLLIDSSNGSFLTDSAGIVVDDADGNYDAFFGAVDTVNGDNSDGVASAVWTFDVTGSTDLEVSFDIAAWGDFEDPEDVYTISVAIDGSTVATISLVVLEDTDQTYTLADGDSFTLDDPMSIGGTALNNVYQTFSTGNLGAGDTVTVTVDAVLDGGSEGIALDNVTISNIPEPTSLALLGLGGLLVARRRRG